MPDVVLTMGVDATGADAGARKVEQSIERVTRAAQKSEAAQASAARRTAALQDKAASESERAARRMAAAQQRAIADNERMTRRQYEAQRRYAATQADAIAENAKRSQGGGGFMAGLGRFAAPMLAGMSVAGGLAFAKSSMAESDAFAKGMARMPGWLGASGRERVAGFAGVMETRTGVDDARVASMIGKSLSAGERNLNNAMAKVRLALDIEAMGLGDAESAMTAFTKAGAESEMQVKRMAAAAGIQATDGMALTEVLRRLQVVAGGAAERVFNASGGLDQMTVAWNNIKQRFGDMLNNSGATKAIAEAINPESKTNYQDTAQIGRMRQSFGRALKGVGLTSWGESQIAAGQGWVDWSNRQLAAGQQGQGTPTIAGEIGNTAPARRVAPRAAPGVTVTVRAAPGTAARTSPA